MNDVDFYQKVLGLEAPWEVQGVELDMEAKRVVVKVGPAAGAKWAGHVHRWRERVWRHLDTCQFETLIAARVPSVKHADGRVEEVAVPWAERYQRVTRLMAQAVVAWLQACGSVSQVAAVMPKPRARPGRTQGRQRAVMPAAAMAAAG